MARHPPAGPRHRREPGKGSTTGLPAAGPSTGSLLKKSARTGNCASATRRYPSRRMANTVGRPRTRQIVSFRPSFLSDARTCRRRAQSEDRGDSENDAFSQGWRIADCRYTEDQVYHAAINYANRSLFRCDPGLVPRRCRAGAGAKIANEPLTDRRERPPGFQAGGPEPPPRYACRTIALFLISSMSPEKTHLPTCSA